MRERLDDEEERKMQMSWSREPGDNRPVGWWDCKKCHTRSLPPLSNKCRRCGQVRPGCEVDPAKPPKPKEPTPPKTPKLPPDWKSIIKQVVGWGGAIATALAVVSIFVPQLKPIAAIIKAVIAAIAQIVGA